MSEPSVTLMRKIFEKDFTSGPVVLFEKPHIAKQAVIRMKGSRKLRPSFQVFFWSSFEDMANFGTKIQQFPETKSYAAIFLTTL